MTDIKELVQELEYANYHCTSNKGKKAINDALDLINRLQADKDRLQRLLDEEERKNITLAKQMFKSGVKDFGKLLIDKSKNGVVSICDIPDLVKEMVGE